jgi:hypothetical protein
MKKCTRISQLTFITEKRKTKIATKGEKLHHKTNIGHYENMTTQVSLEEKCRSIFK